MALFVLAFAIALRSHAASRRRRRPPRRRRRRPAARGGERVHLQRPGLAWFALALPLWLGARGSADAAPVDWRAVRGAAGRAPHRRRASAPCSLIAVAVVAIGPASEFVEKIDDVQESPGGSARRSSRARRSGSGPRATSGSSAARSPARWSRPRSARSPPPTAPGPARRRREFALLATLIAGARRLRRRPAVRRDPRRGEGAGGDRAARDAGRRCAGCSRPGRARTGRIARYASRRGAVRRRSLGSTLLALRAAPVGFDERQRRPRGLAERIDGDAVVFLGVDRFAGYYLRGTLARAPAATSRRRSTPRPEKIWQQGQALDFDTLEPGKLDKFRLRDHDRRRLRVDRRRRTSSRWPATATTCSGGAQGETPRSRCSPRGRRPRAARSTAIRAPGPRACATATGARPASVDVDRITTWVLPAPARTPAAGQERGFAAPGRGDRDLGCRWSAGAATRSRSSTTRRCR